MKKCKHVQVPGDFCGCLEKIDEQAYKLKEITGTIIFCESNQYNLVIRLENKLKPETTSNKKIVWNFEKNQPLPAICGQKLRCFYGESGEGGESENPIIMEAYELIRELEGAFGNDVVRRGCASKKYKFIDFNHAT